MCSTVLQRASGRICLFSILGFLDSINAIRVIAVEYELPVVMILGSARNGSGPDTRHNPDKLSVRIVEPICHAMGLDYEVLFDESNISAVEAGINRAYEQSRPFAILIARSPE